MAQNLTLQTALALPQAAYVRPEAVKLSGRNMISAHMDAVVITNPTSLRPIPYTDGFSTCTCIAVKNIKTGAIALGHIPTYPAEALERMIPLIRRGEKDKLEVHVIGACEIPDKYHVDKNVWQHTMQALVDVMNRTPNATLKTFDVGTKPHPDGVAVTQNAQGETVLVRSSRDYTSIEDMDRWLNDPPAKNAPVIEDIIDIPDKREMIEPPTPPAFCTTSEEPFCVTYDGRLPDNQPAKPPPRSGGKGRSP